MQPSPAGSGGPPERPPANDPQGTRPAPQGSEEEVGKAGEAGEGAGPAREARGRVVIPNPEGLHARPCHALVSLAREHASELWVGCEDRMVSGHSILELMTLAAGCGTELTFVARGPDAEALVTRLEVFVRSGFTSRG